MRKCFCCLLAVCLIILLATPALAALPSGTGKITDCKAVSGSEFSSKSSIAKKLDKMFAGDIGLYKDKNKTILVDASLGTRNVPNNNVYQYWGPTPRAGTSCFAYANAFYGHFYDGVYPHHSLNSNHKIIKATGKITYQNFVKWGVRDDAVVYIREGNHSIIVLTYDKNYLTYVDGNGDGKGLIAIRKEAWQRGSGANIYNQKPSLIVQPTTKYFPAGNMKSQGTVPCTQGGNSHDWNNGSVTKKATCKETGLKMYTCLDCGLTREETLKKTTAHSYGAWFVAREPTCTKKGVKAAQCSICGTEKTKFVKALGHQYGKVSVVQEGTIYSPGITKRTCEICGKVNKEKSDCVVENATFGITFTTIEGVFPKDTELSVEEPGTPEQVQLVLRGVTAKSCIFVPVARVGETSVQPDGMVTLTMKIPEGFSNNLGLYQATEAEAVSLPSTVDLETGTLTAKLQKFATFALCDLNAPWRPEPKEVTEPATEPVTEPTAAPAPVATEERDMLQQLNRKWILWIAVAAVPVVCSVTLIVILIVRRIKKRKIISPIQDVQAIRKEATPEEESVL